MVRRSVEWHFYGRAENSALEGALRTIVEDSDEYVIRLWSYHLLIIMSQIIKRSFSLYLKQAGTFTYESYANKIRDKGLDFPHGKRNKIVLAARELDHLLKSKIEEVQSQEELAAKIKDPKTTPEDREKLSSKTEIVSANGCALLYRSMLQMT